MYKRGGFQVSCAAAAASACGRRQLGQHRGQWRASGAGRAGRVAAGAPEAAQAQGMRSSAGAAGAGAWRPPLVTWNLTEGPPGALASQRYRSLCLRASKYSTELQPWRERGREVSVSVWVGGCVGGKREGRRRALQRGMGERRGRGCMPRLRLQALRTLVARWALPSQLTRTTHARTTLPTHLHVRHLVNHPPTPHHTTDCTTDKTRAQPCVWTTHAHHTHLHVGHLVDHPPLALGVQLGVLLAVRQQLPQVQHQVAEPEGAGRARPCAAGGE